METKPAPGLFRRRRSGRLDLDHELGGRDRAGGDPRPAARLEQGVQFGSLTLLSVLVATSMLMSMRAAASGVPISPMTASTTSILVPGAALARTLRRMEMHFASSQSCRTHLSR